MRRRPRAAAVAVSAVTAALSLLSGCAATARTHPDAPPPAPLATAVTTTSGTWATVAVGRAGGADGGDGSGGSRAAPGSTGVFWQLLYRVSGSDSWVDDVAATATATNSGIDLAAAGSDLVAGVRASQNLTFSPVVETATAGSAWTDGLLPGALADLPQAMAASGTGARSAVLGEPGADQRVVSTASDISRWSGTTTARRVASALPGCGLTALEAVSYVGSTVLVGAACSAPGPAGLVALAPGRVPAEVGPRVGGDTTSQVLALSPTMHGASALLMLRRHGQRSLAFTSSDPRLRNWELSPPLELPPASEVVSVTADTGSYYVVVAQGARESLYRAVPASNRWRTLAAPPPGTATVAVLPGGPGKPGSLSVLVTSGTTIVSWDSSAGGHAWVRGQTLQVPVLYGSTS